MKIKIRNKKKLMYATAGLIVLMFTGYVMGEIFSNYVDGSQEITQNAPILEYSDDGVTWVPAEGYAWTLPAQSGTAADLGGEYNFHLQSSDDLEVFFHDTTTAEGIDVTFELASNPGVPITSHSLTMEEDEEFKVIVTVDPKLKSGTYSVGFTINDS